MLCLCLLLVGFSQIAYAADEDFSCEYSIIVKNVQKFKKAFWLSEQNTDIVYEWYGYKTSQTEFVSQQITFARKGSIIFAEAGRPFSATLENLSVKLVLTPDNANVLDTLYSPSQVGITIYYEDGTSRYYKNTELGALSFTYNSAKQTVTISLKDFVPTKNVLKISFRCIYDPQTQSSAWNDLPVNETESFIFTLYMSGAYKLNLTYYQDDKATGLLGNISSKLSDVVDSISNGLSNVVNGLSEGFSNVTKGLSNVVDSIANLPQKLWNLISDGLKNLFVPTSEQITQFTNDMEFLLGQRLGAVWECGEYVIDLAGRLVNADEQEHIEFPEVTVDLAGTPFVFGGWQVKVIPDGFDFLVSSIKMIIGIVCTIAFINALLKRYDEVMGVES